MNIVVMRSDDYPLFIIIIRMQKEWEQFLNGYGDSTERNKA